MAALSPSFATANNLANIFSQSSVLVLLAIGQLFVLLTRGFDISVGAVAALSTVVAVEATGNVGEVGGIVFGIAAGISVGLVNGYLIAYRNMQPIVVTLGTSLVARGAATAIAEHAAETSLPSESFLQAIGYSSIYGVPVMISIAAGIAIMALLITRYIPFGRWLYMVGGNPEAASLVGVPVRATQMGAYVVCSALAGVAGMFLLARSGTAIAIEGAGMELQSIVACVIGGVALSGGRGSIWQTLVGAIFIQALLNGLNLLGSSPFVSELVLGVVIISAGVVDYVSKKFK
jgi:ribose transport system permease protein